MLGVNQPIFLGRSELAHGTFTGGQQHVLTDWVDGGLGTNRVVVGTFIEGIAVRLLAWAGIRDASAQRHGSNEFPNPIEESLSEQFGHSPQAFRVGATTGVTGTPDWRCWRDAQIERAREEPACISRRERSDAFLSRAGESF